jgi:hypothetical protein
LENFKNDIQYSIHKFLPSIWNYYIILSNVRQGMIAIFFSN